jgi:hypothetical protein
MADMYNVLHLVGQLKILHEISIYEKNTSENRSDTTSQVPGISCIHL